MTFTFTGTQEEEVIVEDDDEIIEEDEVNSGVFNILSGITITIAITLLYFLYLLI